MFRFPPRRLAAIALVAVTSLAGTALAARVDVRFVEPEHFTDASRAGPGDAEERRTLAALARHLQQLGERRLPAGQTLAIEVLDVDLAGDVRPFFGAVGAPDTRVLRGRADAPRLQLRYRLQAGDTVLARGEDTLRDPAYLDRSPWIDRYTTLPFEKRLLDRWFEERFAGRQ